MSVCIEFFGMTRRYAGCDRLELTADTLGELLRELAARLPDFAGSCMQDNALRAGYLAGINGRELTTDPATPLHHGDSVQILSADAGG